MAKLRDGLFKRGPIWWVRTDPCTGKPATTRCRDRRAAEQWRAERERLATDSVYAAAQAATLGSWCQRYLTTVQDLKSEATLSCYSGQLGHWVRLLGANYPLGSIGAGTIDAHVVTRRQEGVTDSTISKEIGALSRLLRRAKRAGCYPGDLEALRPPDLAGGQARDRALTREEVMRLLAELKPHHGALVALCVGLGLRRAEAFRLLPTDVDLAAGRVFVGGSKTAESRGYIPITSYFRELVELALPHLPLHPWPHYLRGLAVACRRAGIERCGLNDLRRTHATLLRQAGADIDTARRLLRHATTAMMQRHYDKPSPDQLAERVEHQLAGGPVLQWRHSPDGEDANQQETRGAEKAPRIDRPGRIPPNSASAEGLGSAFAHLASAELRGAAPGEHLNVTETLHWRRHALAQAALRMGVLA